MPTLSRRDTLRLSTLTGAAWFLRPLSAFAEEVAPVVEKVDWNSRAEAAQRSFQQRHWDEEKSLFHSRLPVNPDEKVFDYWWMAQALDVLVDGYERTKKRDYLERAKVLFRGIVKKNGKLTNDYYDDMSWLALALQRLHRYDPDAEVKDAVLALWKDIQGGWTEQHGGGISWSKTEPEYKSVPANAPPVILAARLYRETKNKADLETALKIYDWMEKTLADPDTGLIYDGINRKNSGVVDKNWIFSYNQGTYVGAALELHRVTGKQAYLDTALRTARAAELRLVDDNGVMREAGRGDGGLFKGIFVRYIGDLARHEGSKDPAHAAFILKNAEAAWARVPDPENPVFGGSWRGRDQRGSNELGTQLSAVGLIEQAAACSPKS